MFWTFWKKRIPMGENKNNINTRKHKKQLARFGHFYKKDVSPISHPIMCLRNDFYFEDHNAIFGFIF